MTAGPERLPGAGESESAATSWNLLSVPGSARRPCGVLLFLHRPITTSPSKGIDSGPIHQHTKAFRAAGVEPARPLRDNGFYVPLRLWPALSGCGLDHPFTSPDAAPVDAAWGLRWAIMVSAPSRPCMLPRRAWLRIGMAASDSRRGGNTASDNRASAEAFPEFRPDYRGVSPAATQRRPIMPCLLARFRSTALQVRSVCHSATPGSSDAL